MFNDLVNMYYNRSAGYRDLTDGHAILHHEGFRYYVEPKLGGGYEFNQIGIEGASFGATIEEAMKNWLDNF